MNVIGTATPELDAAATVFLEARPRLFQIAYHTLRSVHDAEDIVQDAWLKWQQADRDVVRNPVAFLATATSRLAVNTATSARHRRETYTTHEDLERFETKAGPEASVEHDQEIGQALLVVLQKLTPKERAAFVLREAFGYPYQRIADLLQGSVASARQLLVRAHKGIATRPSRAVSPAEHDDFVTAFCAAARTGDLGPLEQLLVTGKTD